MGMFCYQCEQTARMTGCTTFGVCGKDPDTAALQDLLLHLTKTIACIESAKRKLGESNEEINQFIIDSLFTTVTNVNFDPQNIHKIIKQGISLEKQLSAQYQTLCARHDLQNALAFLSSEWNPDESFDSMVTHGSKVGIERRMSDYGQDIVGLQELLTYGLKGLAAYAKHAAVLGREDNRIFEFLYEALEYLTASQPEMEKLLSLNLRCGEVNLIVLELLDSAHTSTYGHPVPTTVRVTPIKGKAILVSGHDLKDLELLLEQTAGLGINIYTHGEMLPAHGYPELKKHKHLVGNYGGAWQDQREEFEAFPGAILMTTNCIQMPKGSYINRIFTSGLVEWPGVTHITGEDFGAVIRAAQSAAGFAEDAEEKVTTTGFAHNAVLSIADEVISAVKNNSIRHFFLIGGCDGAKTGRDYFTEFAQSVPDDCVILTLACGKYRFNKLEFGDIGGIPRLLDCGQCNDAYSAIKIASALAAAFNCTVNDLPLSLIISWYEQKAVVILLSLLHLGIKNIRLGPGLPAFITPAVLKVLVEQFAIKPITTPERDLEAALACH